MIIPKGIRQLLPPSPTSSGPVFETEHARETPGITPTLLSPHQEDIKTPPMQIRLLLKLQPTPVSTSLTTIHYTHGHIICKPTTLYKDTPVVSEQDRDLYQWGRHQAIDLVFTGHGSYQDHPSSPLTTFQGSTFAGGRLSQSANMTLLRYEFLWQSQDQLHQKTYHHPQKGWITAPLEEAACPLFGFGGFYKPGLSLDKVEQVYFTMVNISNTTHITLSSASFWRQHGVDITSGGTKDQVRYVLSPSAPLHRGVSLGHHIQSGGIKIRWTVTQQLGFEYHSYQFTQPNPHHVEITFNFRSII